MLGFLRCVPKNGLSCCRKPVKAGLAKRFPYGDLGSVLADGRVDGSGMIRWVEVCY